MSIANSYTTLTEILPKPPVYRRFSRGENSMQDYSHKNKPLTGSVASELILEFFDGQTRVPTKEIREKVIELHVSRGGLPKPTDTTSSVTRGLTRLKKQGKAKSRKKGLLEH